MRQIFVKRFDTLPFVSGEIYRYMNSKVGDPMTDALVDSCLDEIKDKFDLSVVWGEFDVSVIDGVVSFEDFKLESRNLAEMLNGCSTSIIFVATSGFEIDRAIKKYTQISPSRALALSAIGSERIETLCNTFCKELKGKYGELTPRFSPGYGDLPLSTQECIFSHLNASKNIGVTLNNSLLMSPSKSVTAIIGIKNNKLGL